MRNASRNCLWCRYWGRVGQRELKQLTSTATATRTAKKAIGLISKTTALHVHHAFFVQFLFPSLHDYNVKVPKFTSRIQLQKHLPTFDEVNEME